MSRRLAPEATKPNPKIQSLQQLIGTWSTTGHHPMVPGTTFHGRTSFEWIEGGAFLMMRSEIDEPEIPSGMAIIGSDDSSDVMTMIYFDERGVSRIYELTAEGNVVRWWRNSPEISQRCAVTVSEDGKTMQTKAEFSKDHGPWGQDLELTYTRVK
jgi:hypothetical protein